MSALWVVLGIVVVIVLAAVWIYNRLVTLRTRVDNGWSQIDVQLRRRADLIPNLVETVKGYATHERELFEHVTEARARSIGATGVSDQADAENQVTAGLRQLLAVVENYPDLKANENFLALQEELVPTDSGPVGLVIALIVAVVMSVGSYLYGDRIVLASTRAKEVSKEDAPRLHNIVEGLAIAAGTPKPKVWIVPESAPNAFATGRDPEHSHVAVTQGLLEAMNRVELEGVIGHEMAHVLDRDILVGTVVATLVGAAVLLAEFFMRMWWWGGFRGRRGSDSGGGAASAIIFAVGFLLLILAPIFGQLIRLAVSRNREFLADAQGAMLTRYPPGLIAALKKLQSAPTAMRSANNATAHLWLNQPSRLEGERLGTLERLFSTHPPLAERVRRLEEM